MPVSLYIVALDIAEPTGAVRTGAFNFVASAGDSVGPLTINISGLTSGPVPMTPLATGDYGYQRTGLAPGTYDLEVQDGSPAGLPGFTHRITIFEPPAPVLGCPDPDADNYDPQATQDNGSCVYSRHVELAQRLPELLPLGVPGWVTLAAGATGAVGAPATCLLDLAALGALAGVQVRVDGYLFTSGPLIVPGRFTDAPSLLAALGALPALAARYQLSSPAAGQVLLTARQPGGPGAPVVTTSNAQAVALSSAPGVAARWSQRRYRWACYLEVWAGCGSQYGGLVDKASATLAQRLELPYRADNAYTFDLSPALRGFTGHGSPGVDGSAPDRLVSYFLRYGESYADSPTGVRRVGTTYESPIAWGLEAVQVPAALGAVRPLTTRPSCQVAPGARLPFAVLAPAGTDAQLLLRYRLATSREWVSVLYPHALGLGQVTRTALRLPAVAGLLNGELRVSDSQGTLGPVLAALTFDGLGQALTFVNRAGGQDTVWLAGSQELTGKRTAATFTNALGPQGLSADYQPTRRLYSQLLDLPTWDWLRQELAVSPQAWLETDADPLPVLVSELVTEADAIKGQYSLSVDLQPAPVRGLSS